MILIKKISLCFLFSIAISLALHSLFADYISGNYFTENWESKPFNAISLVTETENSIDETRINNAMEFIGDQPYISKIPFINFHYYIPYIPAIWQPPKDS